MSIKALRRVWHIGLRDHFWHAHSSDAGFIWRRYRPETDEWEFADMTRSEQAEEFAWWATK